MQKLKILFWITIGLIIILPGVSVKALSLGGVNVNVVTSGDGLYTDSYENGRYVYKGTNPNNYIDLGGDMWRIVAIESNGTIKLVKDNFITEMAFDKAGTRTSGYCAQGDAIAEGCNAWSATSTFSNGSFSGEVSSASQLNAYLNGTYYNSLNATARSMIVNGEYKAAPVSSISISDLSEQIGYASEAIWKGKVGLLDATEYMRATTGSSVSSDNWLNINDVYWTMSPDSNSRSRYVWYVVTSGYLTNSAPRNSNGVRPVVTLSSNIQITGGAGTSSDPYTLGG